MYSKEACYLKSLEKTSFQNCWLCDHVLLLINRYGFFNAKSCLYILYMYIYEVLV